MAKKQTSGSAPAERVEGALRFSRLNWILLLLGIVCVVAGYTLLADGSTVAAPPILRSR